MSDDPKTRAKTRLNIVRWHAAVCLDGGDKRSAAWKSKLAKLIEVTPSTVTNWCGNSSVNAKKGQRTETIDKLARLEDEAFAKVLGFNFETTTNGADRSANQRILMALNGALNEHDYADVCLTSGISLKAEERLQAEIRRTERVQFERDRQARWRPREKACWWQSANKGKAENTMPEIPMHISEKESIAKLFEVLADGGSSSTTTILHARPYAGTAYALSRLLPDEDRFRTVYGGGIHHLHTDAVDNLSEIRRILSKRILDTQDREIIPSHDQSVARSLAKHLHSQSQLLIVHGATLSYDRTRRFIDALADELVQIGKGQANKRVSRLLLTCWDLDSYAHLNNARPRRFEYQPTIDSNEAIAYFAELLEHYVNLRNQALELGVKSSLRPDGSLMKRVAYHYNGKSTGYTEMPSAVRFRAFCASDISAPSPFDPTQGVWHRVDERLRSRIPEIAGCLGDIQSDVRAYRDPGQANDLTMLRLISTGLFFFTDTMLERLKTHAVSMHHASGASFELHRPRRNYVQIERRGEIDHIATMPLLVRSLIQDDWARFHPPSRCAIHEAIADVLYNMAVTTAEGQLENELPYTPPRGHDKIALALEAIRHFMRAATSADTTSAERLTRRALDTYDQFLETGVFPSKINEGHTLKSKSSVRRLSRAYGLVSLKFEVLCLLSKDGRGRQPPRGIDGHSCLAFFREIGIALTRLLRPLEAICAFSAALNTDGWSKLDESYLYAHFITAYLTLGDTESASALLRKSRLIEINEDLHEDMRAIIKNRNDAREAAIMLSSGIADRSAEVWANLASNGLVAFWSDRAIGYIDAHMASEAAWNNHHQLVWAVAEQASNKAFDDGLEDERLRINIRRAAIVRRLGYPAVSEAILDQIGLDLGEHGGSEIVFREFQFESAATLAAQGRTRYAFSAYAWPAFQALCRGSAAPWIDRARQQCEALLKSVELTMEEQLPALEDHPFWLQSEANDHNLAHPFFSLDLLPPLEKVRALFDELADDRVRQTYRDALKPRQ